MTDIASFKYRRLKALTPCWLLGLLLALCMVVVCSDVPVSCMYEEIKGRWLFAFGRGGGGGGGGRSDGKDCSGVGGRNNNNNNNNKYYNNNRDIKN